MELGVWPVPAKIEQRARRIRDPVRRLRYLQEAMKPQPGAAPAPAPAPAGAARRMSLPLLAAGLFFAFAAMVPDSGRLPAAPSAPPVPVVENAPGVWLAEKGDHWELYSNGLRVESRGAVSAKPRLYRALPRSSAPTGRPSWRTVPAGIVFHASESELAAFDPAQTGRMKRQGAGLLGWVRRHGLYHFVVDRFGRVHRTVEESHTADHAGHSVWADSEWIYVNLNASFLGVAFEARTAADGEGGGISPAQVHAGRILIQMLRSKYGIPADNCITHAQVSVNPRNFRIGFHTDWARNFPFRQLGLPDNYRQPLPSVCLFGFSHDPAFFESADGSLKASLLDAEEQLQQQAAGQAMKTTRWKAVLNQRFLQAALQAGTDRAALAELAVQKEFHP